MLTPVERHGDVYLKRDDLYRAPGGAPGGKARTCYAIARAATRGLVTAGSRSSPQVNIVARIGAALGLPVRIHTPQGKPGPEVEAAVAAGAERIEHYPGYNTVLVARARADAEALGWTEIPFGMQTDVAVEQTARQVENVPDDVERIVVPVGSGMSLAGILAGLAGAGRADLPVLGVVVGADPTKRLDRYAPGWRARPVDLVPAGMPYDRAFEASVGSVALDPIYEAKCAPHLRPGDLLWIVGIRQTAVEG